MGYDNLTLQVEDQGQPFLARAIMDRECPYDQSALSFRVSPNTNLLPYVHKDSIYMYMHTCHAHASFIA